MKASPKVIRGESGPLSADDWSIPLPEVERLPDSILHTVADGGLVRLCGIDWSTLSRLGNQAVTTQPKNAEVLAEIFTVWTIGGDPLEAWRILEGGPDERYNCHGLSLRTHEAPGGPYWIDHPEAAIVGGFRRLGRGSKLQADDLALWWSESHYDATGMGVMHTAPLVTVEEMGDGINAAQTIILHKNGACPNPVRHDICALIFH